MLKIPKTLYLKVATVGVTAVMVLMVKTTGALRTQPVVVVTPLVPIGSTQKADKNGVIVIRPDPETSSQPVAPSQTSGSQPTKTTTPTQSSQKQSTVPQTTSPTTPISSTPQEPTAPTPSPTPPPTTPPPPPPPTYTYKNGTYSVVGSYSAPSGTEPLGVTLVINNDVISDSTVVAMSSNGTSKYYQDDFVLKYKSLVVGKKLSEIFLNKVSISSLTPTGFNNAVITIRTAAK